MRSTRNGAWQSYSCVPNCVPRPSLTRMNVLSVTLPVGLCLTGIFVMPLLSEHLRRRETGPEHDSLLPPRRRGHEAPSRTNQP